MKIPYEMPTDYMASDHTYWAIYWRTDTKGVSETTKTTTSGTLNAFLPSVAQLANIPFLWTGKVLFKKQLLENSAKNLQKPAISF